MFYKSYKLKIFLSLIIIFIMVFNVRMPLVVHAETAIIPRVWTKYKSTYYYDTLNEDNRKIYDQLEQECIEFISSTRNASFSKKNYLGRSGKFSYIGSISLENIGMYDAMDLVRQFIFDNPQYYFLKSDGVLFEGDNIFEKYLGVCVYNEFAEGDKRAEVTNQIFERIEEWEKETGAAGPSAYDMEMKANSILCENVNYKIGNLDQSIYSAVILGETVCTGYAKTMSLLLNSNGVPAITVRSNTHAWNMVNIDGTWYESDTTWNYSWRKNIKGKEYEEELKSIYSDISTATMHELDKGKSHDIKSNLITPDCLNDYDKGESLYYVTSDNFIMTVHKKDDPDFRVEYYQKGYIPEETKPIDDPDKNENSDSGKDVVDKDNTSENNTSENNASENNNSKEKESDNKNDSKQPAADTPGTTKYSNEWVDGRWYSSDGTSDYEGILYWKSNASGWWVEDTAGWYPISQWQKINGEWYYFDSEGYMASEEWREGCWLNKNGAWQYKANGFWGKNNKGWWYEDTSGWYAVSCWQKIDGYWYFFDKDGYMSKNCYIDGWWIDSDGKCR